MPIKNQKKPASAPAFPVTPSPESAPAPKAKAKASSRKADVKEKEKDTELVVKNGRMFVVDKNKIAPPPLKVEEFAISARPENLPSVAQGVVLGARAESFFSVLMLMDVDVEHTKGQAHAFLVIVREEVQLTGRYAALYDSETQMVTLRVKEYWEVSQLVDGLGDFLQDDGEAPLYFDGVQFHKNGRDYRIDGLDRAEKQNASGVADSLSMLLPFEGNGDRVRVKSNSHRGDKVQRLTILHEVQELDSCFQMDADATAWEKALFVLAQNLSYMRIPVTVGGKTKFNPVVIYFSPAVAIYFEEDQANGTFTLVVEDDPQDEISLLKAEALNTKVRIPPDLM